MSGGPIAPGDVRLQAGAGPAERPADARVVHQGAADRPAAGQEPAQDSRAAVRLCQKHGQSGQEISSALPHIAGIADDICIVRSMVTEAINHDPAHTFMNTGTTISGRPSMGSWLTYGLGSEADDLPGFVVLTSFAGRSPQPISNRLWHSGFLPGKFQGDPVQLDGLPGATISSGPPASTLAQQRDVIDAVRGARIGCANKPLADPEIDTRLAQYEMAFRMQTSVPELMDFRDESQATLDLYGAKPGDGSFASNCLLARRLAERGVRFIQLYHRDWDHHNDLKKFVGICAGACDRPRPRWSPT